MAWYETADNVYELAFWYVFGTEDPSAQRVLEIFEFPWTCEDLWLLYQNSEGPQMSYE